MQLKQRAGGSPDIVGWREELTRPQLCQICPNQTRGAEKMKAAHRGLPNQRKRERGKRKVDADPTITPLIWCQIEARNTDFGR